MMSPTTPILLVDDDPNDIELVLNALKKNNLADQVSVARHGGEALDYLHRRGTFAGREGEDPNFIIMDMKMPKINGLEALRQIKSDERLKLIPVIMLTSSSEASDLIGSYRLGANAYVVKPVVFSQFVDTIRQLGSFWALINTPAPLAQAI